MIITRKDIIGGMTYTNNAREILNPQSLICKYQIRLVNTSISQRRGRF
jgi:hypothetical protein